MSISHELYHNDQPRPLTAEEQKQVLKDRIVYEFTYHAPQGDQVQRYHLLREKGKELALLIVDLTPYSREQSTALTILNLAVMEANAAIARHE